MSIAGQAHRIKPHVGESPWPNHEYVRGYGVFSLPTSTGDVLVLRVLPENDFAPYRTVWHRNRDGAWSMFVDAPTPDIACPRYFGPGVREILPASVDVRWSEPATLAVEVTPAPRPSTSGVASPPPSGRPRLSWTMTMSEPLPLRLLNLASAPMPRSSWKPHAMIRPRELLAEHALGMGNMPLRVTTPSGHLATMCPQRICFISGSKAVLDGRDLGEPVRLSDNPTIGDVRLPKRPTFAVGEGYFQPPGRT